MRFVDAEGVHQLHDVLRHALDGVGDPAVVALTDPAVVVQHHLEALGEGGNLIAPIGAVAAQAADEEDGETGAVPLVMKMAVANRNARHSTEVRLASLSWWLNMPAAAMSNAAGTGQPCAKPQRAARPRPLPARSRCARSSSDAKPAVSRNLITQGVLMV